MELITDMTVSRFNVNSAMSASKPYPIASHSHVREYYAAPHADTKARLSRIQTKRYPIAIDANAAEEQAVVSASREEVTMTGNPFWCSKCNTLYEDQCSCIPATTEPEKTFEQFAANERSMFKRITQLEADKRVLVEALEEIASYPSGDVWDMVNFMQSYSEQALAKVKD